MKPFISIVCALLTGTGVNAHAAELQLREDVRLVGPLVLLGDIASVHARHSVEAAELAVIDLLPVPAAGEHRVLRLREVQDILVLRGVNLSDHRFSGASTVTIRGPRRDVAAAPKAEPLPPRSAASQKVLRQPTIGATVAAIQNYLIDKTGEEGWDITLNLNDERAARIASLGSILTISGGSAPWTGTQQFSVSADNTDEEPVSVTVQITVPPSMVVARHALPKGVILQESDLRLQRGVPTKGEAEVYQSIEEAVGKETTRTIAEGQILDSRTVRRQLLVKRGEIVTLYSRAAGISVRTTARARDDGAQGDLVTIETLQDRKPLFARVSGPQEVEVFAQAVSVSEPK